MSSRAVSEFVRLGTGKDLVVGVLGWHQSRAEHVKKYTDLYNKKGYDTIQFRSLPLIPWFSYYEHRETENLALDLEKIRREGRRLAWHAMSINGAATLVSLDKTYPHLNAIGGSEGILFDSTPVPFGPSDAHMVMDQLMPKEEYSSAIRMAYTANLAALIANVVMRRKLGLKVGEYASYDYLTEHEGMPRHLAMVYSDADHLSNSKLVAEFVAFNRGKGREVDELHFADSPHVGHLHKHPKEYEDLVDRFISRIEGKKVE